MKNWTGERLETFVFNRITIEHLHRYGIVLDYVKDKVVLDIACGEGYGSNILSEKAEFVYGVDIDINCIDRARQKYKKNNLEFIEGNTSEIPLKDNSVDIIISFETIEHHDEHCEMMIEFKRVLKTNGVVIISTPDKLFYSDKRNYYNEHHVKELYKYEFKGLLASHFSDLQLLNQTYRNGNSIIQEDLEQDKISFFTGDYSSVQNIEVNPMFLLIIASNTKIKKVGLSIFDGGNISNLEMLEKIHKSRSYRLGHFLLVPLKKIKYLYKKHIR
ncbi:class I SAM-dependent methyltransferase [Flavobacterium granuli]|uniref:Ubiquinone/menaquinone biosynthesis C-methylase UbiE n=1 Tax=Flavobacterium granuli TaxID=280093 RepID=A0ABU1S5U3_9FLAO|nr:class I SAM-dependent methyltransferase [Flavobacterium granuli]MDR6846414.1 ubiquinone/menaquinone biosynthesis C-methylase UbiE [Flavobacterium granuli]